MTPRWWLKSSREDGFILETKGFKSNEHYIEKITKFQFGEWYCIQDNEPFIDLNNQDGLVIQLRPERWRLLIINRDINSEWNFPEELTMDEKMDILHKWDIGAETLLDRDLGYKIIKTEHKVIGTLTLEKTFQTRFTIG